MPASRRAPLLAAAVSGTRLPSVQCSDAVSVHARLLLGRGVRAPACLEEAQETAAPAARCGRCRSPVLRFAERQRRASPSSPLSGRSGAGAMTCSKLSHVRAWPLLCSPPRVRVEAQRRAAAYRAQWAQRAPITSRKGGLGGQAREMAEPSLRARQDCSSWPHASWGDARHWWRPPSARPSRQQSRARMHVHPRQPHGPPRRTRSPWIRRLRVD